MKSETIPCLPCWWLLLHVQWCFYGTVSWLGFVPRNSQQSGKKQGSDENSAPKTAPVRDFQILWNCQPTAHMIVVFLQHKKHLFDERIFQRRICHAILFYIGARVVLKKITGSKYGAYSQSKFMQNSWHKWDLSQSTIAIWVWFRFVRTMKVNYRNCLSLGQKDSNKSKTSLYK